MTTLEKIARAIDPEAWEDVTGEPRVVVARAIRRQIHSVAHARAALEAMREPNAGVTAAMNESAVGNVCLEPYQATDARMWAAGIDAILAGDA